MQDIIKLGEGFTKVIQNENIGSILFDIDVKTNNGGNIQVADVIDWNKISIDLTYKNAFGGQPVQIFSGYLWDLLKAMYEQDPRLFVNTRPYKSGYKVKLNFENYPLTIKGGAKLELACKFPKDAFGDSNLITPDSVINVETLPSTDENFQKVFPLIQTVAINEGRENFDEQLGNNINSIIVVTDNHKTYDDSTNAKVRKLDLYSDVFEKSVTENALIAENLDMLAINPDSPMYNLVIYREANTLLNDVRLKAQFNKGVAQGTKIITTKLQSVQ